MLITFWGSIGYLVCLLFCLVFNKNGCHAWVAEDVMGTTSCNENWIRTFSSKLWEWNPKILCSEENVLSVISHIIILMKLGIKVKEGILKGALLWISAQWLTSILIQNRELGLIWIYTECLSESLPNVKSESLVNVKSESLLNV